MEVNKIDYIKVGLFVIICFILFFIGYNWISSEKRKKHLYTYYIKLPRATLISPGTKVLVRGVPNGDVIKVELTENGVIAKIGLKDFKLKNNAYAQIISPSALGTRVIDIEPGNGDFLKLNDTIIGYDSPTFDQILILVINLSQKIDSILSNTNNLVKNANYQVENISDKLNSSLNNINSLISELKIVLNHQNQNLDSISTNINTLLNSGQSTIKSLDSLIYKLSLEIDSLKYRGTIGKLTKDDSLYLEIKNSIIKLQALIDDIKKNPSRYINVKIF
ncbi:MAG: MlaD family protein [candidate division WOR-3 bacterium]